MPSRAQRVQRERGAPKGLLLTAAQFNELIPVGRRVRFYPVAGEERFEDTKTRTPAWELGNGQPVVSVEGRAGGVAIDHIELLEDA